MFQQGERIKIKSYPHDDSVVGQEAVVTNVWPDGVYPIEADVDGYGLMAFNEDEVEALQTLAPDEIISSRWEDFPILTLPSIFTEPTPDEKRTGWNIDLLNLAAEYERPVTFKYQKDGAEDFVVRTLIPQEILTTRSGNLAVVGEDEDRDEIRSFRIDRIVGFVSDANH